MSDCDWLSAFRAKLTVAIAVVPLPVAGASSEFLTLPSSVCCGRGVAGPSGRARVS